MHFGVENPKISSPCGRKKLLNVVVPVRRAVPFVGYRLFGPNLVVPAPNKKILLPSLLPRPRICPVLPILALGRARSWRVGQLGCVGLLESSSWPQGPSFCSCRHCLNARVFNARYVLVDACTFRVPHAVQKYLWRFAPFFVQYSHASTVAVFLNMS